MKTLSLFFLLSFLLYSCTTRTEVLPDGTTVKTEAVDKDLVTTGVVLVKILIDKDSGK